MWIRPAFEGNTEIRRIFEENPEPSFCVIDAVGKGANWPTLLVHKPEQQAALKENDAWVQAKALFRACLGLKLKIRGKIWSTVADELWRFLLFIDRAEFIKDELDLKSRCQALKDLGVRETFPFEERTFF